MIKIPVTIMRGGTSKGVYILKNNLPEDEGTLKSVILAIFGSPDVRQIDGLGGADPLTSKVAIVKKSERVDADVDYTFGQVGISIPTVDFSLSCGNLISGVGAFAIFKGLVKAVEPFTIVDVFDTNIRKYVRIKVPVRDGMPLFEGDFHIDGVPFSGARTDVTFIRPAGSITGGLLPTGNIRDVADNGVEYTLVDAGVLAMFVKASDIGLSGKEGPQEIDGNVSLMKMINEMRSDALLKAGLGDDKKDTSERFPNLPKFVFVAPPENYTSPINGRSVRKEEIDLLARMVTGSRLHKAFAVTSSIALAAASVIEGSIVDEIIVRRSEGKIYIGHASGIMDVGFKAPESGNIEEVTVGRTTRLIMDGLAYIPKSRLCGVR